MCNMLVFGGLSRFLGGVLEVHFDPEHGGSTHLSETSATLLISIQFRYPKNNQTTGKKSENLKSIRVTLHYGCYLRE
jgi:hypothetical protein